MKSSPNFVLNKNLNPVFVVHSIRQLENFLSLIEGEKIEEFSDELTIVLPVKKISRYGHIDENELIHFQNWYLEKTKGNIFKFQLNLFLEADCLLTENLFENYWNMCSFLLCKYSFLCGLRVVDLGLVKRLQTLPNGQIKWHFNAEHSYHNRQALQEIISHPKSSNPPQRILISPEIPWNVLKEWQDALDPIEIETLTWGPLLLFYSGRQLGLKNQSWMELDSLESAHSQFLLKSDSQGSLFYHGKDLCVWKDVDTFVNSLNPKKNIHIRFDFSHLETSEADFTNCQEFWKAWQDTSTIRDFSRLLDIYPRKTTQGLGRFHRTDVLFSKLKNPYTQRHDQITNTDNFTEYYLGTVRDIEKHQYTLIEIFFSSECYLDYLPLRSLTFYTPSGKKIIYPQESWKKPLFIFENGEWLEVTGAKWESFQFCDQSYIFKIPYIAAFGPSTQMYALLPNQSKMESKNQDQDHHRQTQQL